MKKNVFYHRPSFHFYKVEEKEKKVISALLYGGDYEFMTLDEAKKHRAFEVDEPDCLKKLITKKVDNEKVIATLCNKDSEDIYLLTEQGREVFEKLSDIGIIWAGDYLFDGLNKI